MERKKLVSLWVVLSFFLLYFFGRMKFYYQTKKYTITCWQLRVSGGSGHNKTQAAVSLHAVPPLLWNTRHRASPVLRVPCASFPRDFGAGNMLKKGCQTHRKPEIIKTEPHRGFPFATNPPDTWCYRWNCSPSAFFEIPNLNSRLKSCRKGTGRGRGREAVQLVLSITLGWTPCPNSCPNLALLTPSISTLLCMLRYAQNHWFPMRKSPH